MARTVYLQVSIEGSEWDAFTALSPAGKLAFIQQRALAKATADIQAAPPDVVSASAALLKDTEKQAVTAAIAAVPAAAVSGKGTAPAPAAPAAPTAPATEPGA